MDLAQLELWGGGKITLPFPSMELVLQYLQRHFAPFFFVGHGTGRVGDIRHLPLNGRSDWS